MENIKKGNTKKTWKKPCLTILSVSNTRLNDGIGDDGGSADQGS